jgi:uncharacterized protein (DUF4415 family)
MAKKSSASSQPERLKRMKSEDIWRKPLTKTEQETLYRHAARQAAGDDSHINFEGMPRLTTEQLAGMTRLKDRPNKIAVSVRLDPRVIGWLKGKGEGYLTRINDILANVMDLEAKHRDRQGKEETRNS